MDKVKKQYSLQQLRNAWGAGRREADDIIEESTIVLNPDDVKKIKLAMVDHLNDRLHEASDVISIDRFADYDSAADTIWELHDRHNNNPRIENILSVLWLLNEHFYTAKFF
ncbi:MAG: hypothetical protein HZA20_12350 [Nitrospirae bacterium]|nr:hypothetical protein [Nitrospirota bacterium]